MDEISLIMRKYEGADECMQNIVMYHSKIHSILLLAFDNIAKLSQIRFLTVSDLSLWERYPIDMYVEKSYKEHFGRQNINRLQKSNTCREFCIQCSAFIEGRFGKKTINGCAVSFKLVVDIYTL